MNDKEKRFCEEYLVDLDAEQAALRAGYRPKTARYAAAWLDPGSDRYKLALLESVQTLARARASAGGVTADRVLREYARIAFANVREAMDAARLKEGADADDIAAVASVKIKGDDCDIHMYDKMKALDVLGRRLGMFDESDGKPVRMPTITALPDGSVTVDGPR